MTKTYGNFSDFITFTRASAATIRDAADGDKIKWPGHNLFAYSQELDQVSFWSKSNATVSANSGVDIAGGTTADALIENTANSTHSISQQVPMTAGVRYTFAVIANASGREYIDLSVATSVSVTNIVRFYLADGGLSALRQGNPTPTHDITDLGNGLYLCEMHVTASSTATAFCSILLAASASGSPSYLGDGVSGVNLSFLRLYRSDLPMVANPDYPDDPTYYPTTGTAIGLNDRPRGNQPTGTAGKRGLLVEPARTNLFTYSNDLSNAVWLNFNTTVTGTTTATLTPISAGPNVYPFYRLAVTVTNPSVITQTIEAKSNGYDFIALSLHNGATTAGNEVIQVFDIANGTVESTYNTAPTTSTIEELSDGWYRLSITWTVASTFAVPGFWPLDSDRAPRTSWTADGTSGVMIRYLQMEVGSYPTSYIPTAGATATRAEENPNITPESFGYNTKTGTWIAEVYDTNFTTGNSRILGAEGAECVFAHNNIDADVVNFNGTDALVKNSALTGGSGKLALSYEPGSRRMIINATSPVGAVGDYLDTNPPTIFSIGTGVGLPMGGVITSLKYYPRALSDTQLQELTS